MKTTHSISFKLIFFVLAGCTAVFAVIFGYNYYFSREMIVQKIEGNARDLAALTVQRIETVLQTAQDVPRHFALHLENTQCGKEELIALLKAMVADSAEVYGSTPAFEPYSFDKTSLYFAPYAYKNGKEVKLSYLGGDKYRYFYWDWYQIPKELNQAIWTEPYFDEGGGDIIMSTYSVPFYRTADGVRKFWGIVTADLSLTWLQEIISSIKIGKTGYGFLISKNGRFVTHPMKQLIMNETIFSMAEARNDSRLRAIGRDMIQGNSGFVRFQNMVSDQECWLAYAPVPSSGWSLGVVFPKEELMAPVDRLTHVGLVVVLLGFLFLWLIITGIAHSITRPLRILSVLTKDIAQGNLDFELTSIRSKDEVGRLAQSFLYMKDAWKKYIRERTETTAAKERMESELKIAHDIQMSLLPKGSNPFPKKTEFSLHAVLLPAKEVGGDLYDYFMVDREHLCFVVGDVSDKGVPAALFMAMAKTLIKIFARENPDPADILRKVNEGILGDNEMCMFITLFCGVLNIATGEISYCNGGHNPPLILRAGGSPVEMLQGPRCPVVGVNEEAVYTGAKALLQPGDAIFLYTDGITEAFNVKQEIFSEERLISELATHQQESVDVLVSSVLEEVRSFTRGAPPSDDVTILALRYHGGMAKRDSVKVVEKWRAFTLQNRLEEIPKVNDEIARVLRQNEASDAVIGDVHLALEELLSNIILYGFQDKNLHEIQIALSRDGTRLIFRLEDDGRPFNPLIFPPPDLDKPLEERAVGGLGIHFARTVMDAMEYIREGNKNILVLKKMLVDDRMGNKP